MDRSEMEKMFYDGIMPREMCCPEKKEYRQTMKLLSILEEELCDGLTPEQFRMLEDWKGYQLTLNTFENEEHFIQGLSLGIRMTAEAFTIRTGKSDA